MSRRATILVGSILGTVTVMSIAAMPTWFRGNVLDATGTPSATGVAVLPSPPSGPPGSSAPATGTPVTTPAVSPAHTPVATPPRDTAGGSPTDDPTPVATPVATDPATDPPTARPTPTEAPTPRPTPRPTPPPTPAPTPTPDPDHAIDFEWSEVGNERVKFRSLAAGDPIHEWAFGDGNEATGRNPMHRYAGPGTYRVTLTVTWPDGVVRSVARDVTVG